MAFRQAEKQSALVAAAKKDLAGLLEVNADEAGMHLVGWLPENMNDRIASEKAAEQDIETKPLSVYSSEPLPQRGGLILGYTAFSAGQIRNGVRRLAKALT